MHMPKQNDRRRNKCNCLTVIMPLASNKSLLLTERMTESYARDYRPIIMWAVNLIYSIM